MNLHEKCLLKYLLNPFELSNSTELLKMNNLLIEKSINNKPALKIKKSKYALARI